jgi:hypothetical protein
MDQAVHMVALDLEVEMEADPVAMGMEPVEALAVEVEMEAVGVDALALEVDMEAMGMGALALEVDMDGMGVGAVVAAEVSTMEVILPRAHLPIPSGHM